MHKYKPGREIITFEGLRKILEKNQFVYLRNKIYHEGWVLSLQFKYLADLLDNGLIKRAVKISKN